MPLTPGTKLGPYEVTGAVGAGGMGEVYRARDERLGRDVAVKVLPASLSDDAAAADHRERKRFPLTAPSRGPCPLPGRP